MLPEKSLEDAVHFLWYFYELFLPSKTRREKRSWSVTEYVWNDWDNLPVHGETDPDPDPDPDDWELMSQLTNYPLKMKFFRLKKTANVNSK